MVAIDQEDCKDLITFVKRAWHTIEPGTPFSCGWAVECMAEHLMAVTKGEIKRLLINVPPGATKSCLTNTFWPAFEWGPLNLPHLRYISASYERGLAVRDMIRCRDIITTKWFQDRWPIHFKADQSEKMLYVNDDTGWRFASSVGGRLTGYRGDRIIIDDPLDVKAAESDIDRATATRWFSETLPTRLNKMDDSAMVMIMQRLHVQDLSGVVISSDLAEDWVHLCLPMECELKNRSWTSVPNGTPPQRMYRNVSEEDPVPFYTPDQDNGELLYLQDPRTEEGELMWPERFSADAVKKLKKAFSSGDGGSYAASGQLQQRPVHRDGGLFKRADFHITNDIPQGCAWVRGWDLAATKSKKASYTVGVKLGVKNGVLYISDITRFKGTPTEVEQRLRETAEMDGESCAISLPQDPGQAGVTQKSRLAQVLTGFNVHFSTESGEKAVRATPVVAQVGAGNVYLKANTHWLPSFLAEAGLFPAGAHDDQIDALSRAYSYLLKNNGNNFALTPSICI